VFKRWLSAANGVLRRPTLYVAMLACEKLPHREQVALRICASAGEALSKRGGEKFHTHFDCHILDGLGSRDAAHLPVQPRGRRALRLHRYSGARLRTGTARRQRKPFRAVKLAICTYAAPARAAVLGQSEKSRATFVGDWVKSGDKYSIDENGYYTYAGRTMTC